MPGTEVWARTDTLIDSTMHPESAVQPWPPFKQVCKAVQVRKLGLPSAQCHTMLKESPGKSQEGAKSWNTLWFTELSHSAADGQRQGGTHTPFFPTTYPSLPWEGLDTAGSKGWRARLDQAYRRYTGAFSSV